MCIDAFLMSKEVCSYVSFQVGTKYVRLLLLLACILKSGNFSLLSHNHISPYLSRYVPSDKQGGIAVLF